MTGKIVDKIKGGDTTIYLRKSNKNWLINTRYSSSFQSIEGQQFVGKIIDSLKQKYGKKLISRAPYSTFERLKYRTFEENLVEIPNGMNLRFNEGYGHYKISGKTSSKTQAYKTWRLIKSISGR